MIHKFKVPNKEDITKTIDLYHYLHNQALENDFLYHYTTLESLVSILKTKSFRLSRLDMLNDYAELKLGDKFENSHTYIMSLTGAKEQIAMWAIYGKASGIKIRLGFSIKEMKLILDDFRNRIYQNIDYNEPILKHQKVDLWGLDRTGIYIGDIAYFDKENEQIKHKERVFKNYKFSSDTLQVLTGFVKYDAWEFERETRIKFCCESRDDLGKYVYMKLSDELMRSFKITFNPWQTEQMKDEIKKMLDGLSGYKLEYCDSKHNGEVSEL